MIGIASVLLVESMLPSLLVDFKLLLRPRLLFVESNSRLPSEVNSALEPLVTLLAAEDPTSEAPLRTFEVASLVTRLFPVDSLRFMEELRLFFLGFRGVTAMICK